MYLFAFTPDEQRARDHAKPLHTTAGAEQRPVRRVPPLVIGFLWPQQLSEVSGLRGVGIQRDRAGPQDASTPTSPAGPGLAGVGSSRQRHNRTGVEVAAGWAQRYGAVAIGPDIQPETAPAGGGGATAPLKLAVTEVSAVMVTVQLRAVPEQAPAQPENTLPAAGAAVKVTTEPSANRLPDGLVPTVPSP